MKGIKRDTRKKLLDLMEDYEKNSRKEGLENISSDLQITPEFAQNLLDGKETIDDELAKRIEEQVEKHKDIEEDNILFDEKRLRRAYRKRMTPGTGKKINELWNEKFKNQNEEIIVGDEIQNKIENYDKLKFYEKVLTPRDFNYSLYGLQDIHNIPGFGEQIIIVDCNDGTEYPTNIQKNQQSISTGLKLIWDKFNRRKRLKQGDVVGIALDSENNHRIYVDFEYKERDKLDKQKKEYHQEEIRNAEHDTGKDTEISLEKRIHAPKNLKDSQEKTRNIEYSPEKELEISQEKRRYAPRNIYGAIRDSSFRYRILNIYKDKCAICGLQMNLVEACHIIPVEDDGTDEIINGIALCHNHHKAFDSGLIWINEEYDIMLNHSKIKDIKSANIAEGLDDFIKNSRIGEKIFLPDNHKFYPDPDYLTKKRYIV